MQLSSTKGAKVWPITKITFLYGFATSPIYWYRLSLTELSFSECVRVRPNIAVIEQIYSRDSPTETPHRRALEFRYRQSENYRSSFSPKSDSHEQRRELGWSAAFCLMRTGVALSLNELMTCRPCWHHQERLKVSFIYKD
ncbi:hypothetical protein YC2023_066954 [Brassica napus]